MLYQVYLVDDEEYMLNMLAERIPWCDYGFEVAGRSANPEAAIVEIDRICPHAVVADMKMPGMDGLSLMATVKTKHPLIEFLIVSAYSDYPYLRESFKHGVFDYMLKPVNAQSVGPVLEQLRERLKETTPLDLEMEGYDGNNKTMNAILCHMRDNLDKKLSLPEIALKFHFSTSSISSYFVKHMSKTFVAHLKDLRMSRAKELLSGGKPVKEIAMLCGFDDYFYFCRVFKGYYQCTPTEMREALRHNG
jgi:YesN/AraC family two-component response regulator